MKASDIMTRNVVTISADATVREAVALLSENAVGSLPVLDGNGAVVGIVSELDLLTGRMPHDATATMIKRQDGPDPARLVRDVMTEPVACLSATSDASDLAQLLVDRRIRAVPIVDGGQLIGIVSRRDVLRTLLRDDTGIRADVRERLDAYAGATGQWEVTVEEGVVTVSGPFDDDRQLDTVAALAHTVPGVVRVHTRRP